MQKTVKIVVAGDGGVGKTSFLNRLVHDHFNMKSELTRGIDFFSKNIKINGSELNFVLWDFAGQEQFSNLLGDFVDGSIAAYILFDLTRTNTIESVQYWLEKFNEFSIIPIVILGTKIDLVGSTDLTAMDNYINSLIKSSSKTMKYIKVSSKTGFNVKKAFQILIELLSQPAL